VDDLSRKNMFNPKDIKTGKQVKEIRLALHQTQEQFSRSLGFTMNRISLIERKDQKVSPRLRREISKTIKILTK